MKIIIDRGKLILDMYDLVQGMDALHRADLSRYLVADETLFRAVLECVATGEYFSDSDDGAWWFGNQAVTELREKLKPMMSDIARKTVEEMAAQRDRALAEEKSTREWAWAMYHAWPEGYGHRRPEKSA